MPIPSLEQFESALLLANEWFAFELLDRFATVYDDDGFVLKEKEEELRALLVEYFQLKDARWKEIGNSESFRWMFAQPGFIAAREICYFGKRRKKHESDFSIETALEAHFNRAKRSRGHTEVLVMDRLSKTWPIRCLSAFREYFYTDNADKALTAGKRLNEIERSLIKIGDELGALESSMLGGSNVTRLSGRILRQVELIRHSPLLSNIKRDGKQIRERLLAKRIFDANRKVFRATKADAIAELLTVEGVAHQVDLRTVQRWCAAFSEAASTKGASKD